MCAQIRLTVYIANHVHMYTVTLETIQIVLLVSLWDSLIHYNVNNAQTADGQHTHHHH